MKSSNVLFGTSVMAASSAVRVAIQILILPIIGRLLGPKAYGQIALVGPFIYFTMMLAESGLGAVIVKADRLTRELEGTVFCFSAAMSLIFIAIFAALAWPVGQLIGEPDFPPLLMGMSVIMLLAALNIVPAGVVLRKKMYGLVAVADLVSTLAGIAAVIVGIMLEWGAWALVAQQVGFWTTKLIFMTAGARTRPYFMFRLSILKEHISFGSHVTGASIVGFITRNIDNVLIGSLMGTRALGFYALAYQITTLPQTIFSGSAYMSLFSSTSEAVREGRHSARQYLNMLRGVLLLCAPAMVGIAVTAWMAIPLLLGEQWIPAARLIVLLTPFSLCAAFGAASSGLLLGLGKANVVFRMSVLLSSLTIAVIALCATISSDAVAIGLSLAAMFNTVINLRVIAKHSGTSLKQIGKATLAPLVSAILMACVVIAVQQIVPMGWPLAVHFAISILTGVAAYPVFLFGLFHDHLRDDILTIKTALLKRRG